MDAGEYVYCGRIELVDKPYTETQPGEDGAPRKVWMFPIRPVTDNDVKKLPMLGMRTKSWTFIGEGGCHASLYQR